MEIQQIKYFEKNIVWKIDLWFIHKIGFAPILYVKS